MRVNPLHTSAFDNGDILHLTHNGVEATLAQLFQTLVNRDASVSEWQIGKQAASSEVITAIGTVMQFDGWV